MPEEYTSEFHEQLCATCAEADPDQPITTAREIVAAARQMSYTDEEIHWNAGDVFKNVSLTAQEARVCLYVKNMTKGGAAPLSDEHRDRADVIARENVEYTTDDNGITTGYVAWGAGGFEAAGSSEAEVLNHLAEQIAIELRDTGI